MFLSSRHDLGLLGLFGASKEDKSRSFVSLRSRLSQTKYMLPDIAEIEAEEIKYSKKKLLKGDCAEKKYMDYFLGLCCTNRSREPFFPPRFLIFPNIYTFSLLTPHHTTHPIPHLHHPVQNPYPHPYLTFPSFPTPCPYPIAKYPLQP